MKNIKKEILRDLFNNKNVIHKLLLDDESIKKFEEIINFLFKKNIDYKNKFILEIDLNKINIEENENINKLKRIVILANNFKIDIKLNADINKILHLLKILKVWLNNKNITIQISPFDEIIKYLIINDIKYINNDTSYAKKIENAKIFTTNEINDLKNDLERILQNQKVLNLINKGVI